MRPSAALGLVAVWGIATAACAQDGFRAPATGSALADRFANVPAAKAPAAPRLVVSSLGGQGLTLSPSALLGAGLRLRLPSEFAGQGADDGRPTFGLAEPAGTAVDYRYDRWTFSSAVRQGLAAARPGPSRVDIGASYGFNVAPRHQVVLFGGLGITASSAFQGLRDDEIAIRSALDPYRAGSGLRDMGLRLSWRYSIDQRLFLDTSVGFDRNFGDTGAAGSLDRNVGSVGAVFGYRFY